MKKRWSKYVLAVVMTIAGLGTIETRPGMAQADCSTFAQTGQEVCSDFLQYWDDHGQLAQQGYPITGRIQEMSPTNGKSYTVQYFERSVFELHSGNSDSSSQPPYNVLLSQLGTFRYKDKYPNGAPGQEPNTSAGSVLFSDTGKRLGGFFLDYWQKNGGLAQQGFPISDEFVEKSDLDGKSYRLQYFERAVFELHSGNADSSSQPPYNVLLTQLGTLRKQERDGTTVSFMTDDGLKLSGSVYGTGSTWAILTPQCSDGAKESWTDLAVRLGKLGYTALTYYFRGLGTSQGPRDQMAGLHDLRAATAFARSRGAKKLLLAGESCGGTISAKAYATEKPVALIVISSPPSVPTIGVEVSDDEIRAMTVPKLFVGSEGDQFTAPMLQMYDAAPMPKEKLIYTGSAHAAAIFSSEHGGDLLQKLTDFIVANVPLD
jgi:alpha/beta superfamily hydrolase